MGNLFLTSAIYVSICILDEHLLDNKPRWYKLQGRLGGRSRKESERSEGDVPLTPSSIGGKSPMSSSRTNSTSREKTAPSGQNQRQRLFSVTKLCKRNNIYYYVQLFLVTRLCKRNDIYYYITV